MGYKCNTWIKISKEAKGLPSFCYVNYVTSDEHVGEHVLEMQIKSVSVVISKELEVFT